MILHKKSILIIDDDSDVKESMASLLTMKNFSPTLACSGKEGIDKFQKAEFDLVLLDLKMPIMDGYETFEKLVGINPDIDVFFVTGFSTDFEKLQHCKNIGLKGIFTKPVKITEMIQTINRV